MLVGVVVAAISAIGVLFWGWDLALGLWSVGLVAAVLLATGALWRSERDFAESSGDSDAGGGALDEETRFTGYLNVYNNLDRLIWAVPSVLAALLAVSFGFFGGEFGDGQFAVPPLDPTQTATAFYLVVGAAVLTTVYGMATLRLHHTVMGRELRKLDAKGGYFEKRAEIVMARWPPGAPWLFIVGFAVVGVALIWLAGYNLATHAPDPAASPSLTPGPSPSP